MPSQPRNTPGASTPLHIPLHECDWKQSSLSGLWLFLSSWKWQRGSQHEGPSVPRESKSDPEIHPALRAPHGEHFRESNVGNRPEPCWTRQRQQSPAGHRVAKGDPKALPGSLWGWTQLWSRAFILHTGIWAELKPFKHWHALPSFRGYSH